MAYTAQELQQQSRGRLVLGLGPQVKSQIGRRSSAEFDPVLTRMREYALTPRAIWDCRNLGRRLLRGAGVVVGAGVGSAFVGDPAHEAGHRVEAVVGEAGFYDGDVA